MPKFQIISPVWSGGENAPLPRYSPCLYPNGTDVLLAKRRHLKKDSIHLIFGFGDYGYSTPPFLLCSIFLSVCTVTVGSPVPVPRIMSLMTSKFTSCLALLFRVMPGLYRLEPPDRSRYQLSCTRSSLAHHSQIRIRTLWVAIRRSFLPVGPPFQSAQVRLWAECR